MKVVIQRVSSASVTIAGAAGHEKAIPLYEQFCDALSQAIGKPVGTGEFGADMKVALVNDGPVTICIDTKDIK